MRQKGNINQPPEKDFFEKDLVVFFLGPFYYLVLIIFFGNSIFYVNPTESSSRKIWLLASGSLFYFALLLIYIFLS
jgi:hypothetical protein